MHVQKIFMLTEVLNDKWDEFTKEVFHHALRIIDRLPSKPSVSMLRAAGCKSGCASVLESSRLTGRFCAMFRGI